MAMSVFSRCPKCMKQRFRRRHVGGSFHRPIYDYVCESCGWQEGGRDEEATQSEWARHVRRGGIEAAIVAVAQRKEESRERARAAEAAARREAAEQKRQRYAEWPQGDLWRDLHRISLDLPVWTTSALSLKDYLEAAGAGYGSAQFGADHFMDESPEASVETWSLLDGALVEQLSQEATNEQLLVGRGLATWIGDRMGSGRPAWASSLPAAAVLEELARVDAMSAGPRIGWSPDRVIDLSFGNLLRDVHELIVDGRAQRPAPCRWIPDSGCAARWDDAGFGRWAATDFAAAGFEPEQAQRWHAAGYTASQASAATDSGQLPGERPRLGSWTDAFTKSRQHSAVWTVRAERIVEVEERLADLNCAHAFGPGPWFVDGIWSWALLDGLVVGLSGPPAAFSSGRIESGLRVVGADAMAMLCLQLGLTPPRRTSVGQANGRQDLIARWLDDPTGGAEAERRVRLGLQACDADGLQSVVDAVA